MSSPKSVSESSREDQSPKIITFYKDLTNEVDGHFMRALGGNGVEGGGTSAASGSPLSNNEEHETSLLVEQELEKDDVYDKSEQSSSSSLITNDPLTTTTTEPSSLHTIEAIVPTGATDLPLSSRHQTDYTKRDVTPPPLIHTVPSRSSSISVGSAVGSSATGSGNNPSSAIIYPDLAAYLVHPHIDSFSDAPRIHGQPTIHSHTTTTVAQANAEQYIHCNNTNSSIRGTAGSAGTVLQHPSISHYHTKTSPVAAVQPTHHYSHTGVAAGSNAPHLSFMSGGHFSAAVNFAPTSYHPIPPSHNGYQSAVSIDFIPSHHQPAHQNVSSNYSAYDLTGSTSLHHYDSLHHYSGNTADQSCYWSTPYHHTPSLPPPLSHKPHPSSYGTNEMTCGTDHHYNNNYMTTSTNSQWCYPTYPSTQRGGLHVSHHGVGQPVVVDNDIHHILKL